MVESSGEGEGEQGQQTYKTDMFPYYKKYTKGRDGKSCV